MKTMKTMKGGLTDEDEKTNFQDSQQKVTEQSREMHLLIAVIDPAIPMEIKSATFHFQNSVEGLQAFNVLAATARNVHKTCVEDARLYAKVRPPMHHL